MARSGSTPFSSMKVSAASIRENDAGKLDQVLRVLQNIVGERRAVGLISHVPLVQQAVPNGFTVHKGTNGSQITVRSA